MSRVLLIGHPPSFLNKQSKVEAANYRTWQFLDPILADGHEVCLVSNDRTRNTSESLLPESWDGRVNYHPIPLGRRGWIRELQQIHDAFRPDCILAVNFDACLYATRLRTSRPVWMDIYGDYLTIIQAACYRSQSNRGISTSINFLHQVLRTGDIYSVCSLAQRHILVGELAMAGRLSWRTFGYEFTNIIRPGMVPSVASRYDYNGRKLLFSLGIEEDDFVVLWCGGYNTWTDVETLFKGLEWAMAGDPKIQYVSLGASTYDAVDNVYFQFLERINQSQHRERFHMLGWRPWKEVFQYYYESDIGINIDALHYETIYGTRTRLLEMIAAGLPVLTSLGSELSFLLGEKDAALTFDVGDWRRFGEQILRVANDVSLRSKVVHSAGRYAGKELSFHETTKPVREWVCNPRSAPDSTQLNKETKIRQLEYRARSLTRRFIWKAVGID